MLDVEDSTLACVLWTDYFPFWFLLQIVLENSSREDKHECPFGRSSIELTKMLCEILKVGELRKLSCFLTSRNHGASSAIPKAYFNARIFFWESFLSAPLRIEHWHSKGLSSIFLCLLLVCGNTREEVEWGKWAPAPWISSIWSRAVASFLEGSVHFPSGDLV